MQFCNKKFYRKGALVLISSLILALSGCEEPSEAYLQAGRDLEQGSYEYALKGYEECCNQGVLPVMSARGAGIACLRMGNYEDAIVWFTRSLNGEKVDKPTRRDLLYYRATAYLKDDQFDNAMADCQSLLVDYGENAETCFLTGAVALAMDAYEEASDSFDLAYAHAEGYEMAIRIYQQYIERGMEADGTRFLETSLQNSPETAEDYCDRGRVYYYMEDYASATAELTSAVNAGSTEALLLMGMVYNAQHLSSKARAMYQQYLEDGGSAAKAFNGLALCDMEESSFDSALDNIQKGKPYASTEELQSLLFNEIIVYEKKLDFEKAESLAQDYVTMFPEDAQAAKELDFLKSRKKAAVTEDVTEETTSETASDGSAGETSSYDEGSYDDSGYYDESYYDENYYDESYYDEYYYDDGYY